MKYLLILTLFAISCNSLPDENKEIELKPSNFMSPITDTIAVAQDSNAYIINTK